MATQRQHRISVIHQVLAEHLASEQSTGPQEHLHQQHLVSEIERRLDTRISAKTVQRTIAVMRDEMGLPIEFDRRANTYRYTRQVTLQPLNVATLSSLDAQALLAGQRAMALFRGTPWHDGLSLTFKRLLAACPSKVVNPYTDLFARIRFAGPEQRPIDNGLWTQVIQSLDEERTLQVTYRSGRDGVEKSRKLDPYGLVIAEQQWQLIAWDHRTRDVRTFLLQRITEWQITETFFRVKGNFTLDGYLKDAIAGQQTTGQPVLVRLRFTKEATPAAEAQIWHRDERRNHDEQGQLIVEFSTAATFKVHREVLAWGGGCEVLEPKELRDAVRGRALLVGQSHVMPCP